MRDLIESMFSGAEKMDLYMGIIEAVEGITKSLPEDAWLRYLSGDPEIQKKIDARIVSAGLKGIGVDENFGGTGGGLLGPVMVTDLLAQKGIISFASLLAGFCRTPILKYGTVSQIETFVAPTLSGESRFCICVTEPNAGSNTFNISTRARKKGNKWILNGQKAYISTADVADYGLLIAKTEIDNPRALSVFVLDMNSPGIEKHKMNIRISGGEEQFNVFFDDVEMPEDALIGEEGKGGVYMFEGLNAERLMISALVLGYSDLALRITADYVRERTIFDNKPTGSYQAVQHPLALHKAETDAARLMLYTGVRLFDQGKDASVESNMAKLLASNASTNMCDAALQFHGGSGMDEDVGILQLWRTCRTIKIVPINNEMILNHIAENLIGLPKSY